MLSLSWAETNVNDLCHFTLYDALCRCALLDSIQPFY